MFFWNSLAFLMIQWMLAIWSLVPLPFLNLGWMCGSSQSFHVPIGNLYAYFFLRKISIQILCPLFNWIICLLVVVFELYCSLYVLNVNLLSYVWFSNSFFHSIYCLFIWLIVSFALCKNFSVWYSLTCLLLWLLLSFSCNIQNIVATTNVKELFPCFLF